MNITSSTVRVIAQSILQCAAWRSCPPRSSGCAMAPSCGLHPSLHGALVVVATEAIAIAITAAVTATREVALPRRGNVMVLCDADNTGAGATAE